MRLLRYLILFALAAFIVWPYYHVFRLDYALGRDDTQSLEQLLDIPAIRHNYKERLEGGLGLPQPQDADDFLAQLQQSLWRLGDVALEQAITLSWARDTLKEALPRQPISGHPTLWPRLASRSSSPTTAFSSAWGSSGRTPPMSA